MTVKFTKTGVGAEQGLETLLFEFKDWELPSKLDIEYVTQLATNQYVGSLQTNQLQGSYLQPISFEGVMHGGYLDANNKYVTAKQRADELGRLQGRVIKFFYEGIKQLVIIEKFKLTFSGYNKVAYSFTLQPHDIQIAIKPIDQDVNIQNSMSIIESENIKEGVPNALSKDQILNNKINLTKDITNNQILKNLNQAKRNKVDAKYLIDQIELQIKFLSKTPTKERTQEEHNLLADAYADLRSAKAEYKQANDAIAIIQNNLKLTSPQKSTSTPSYSNIKQMTEREQ